MRRQEKPTYKKSKISQNVEGQQPRGTADAAPFLYLRNSRASFNGKDDRVKTQSLRMRRGQNMIN